MPREPFLQAHAKSINVFIKLLNQSNSLNDRFVLPVHIGGALGTRETMTKTELSASDILLLEIYRQYILVEIVHLPFISLTK